MLLLLVGDDDEDDVGTFCAVYSGMHDLLLTFQLCFPLVRQRENLVFTCGTSLHQACAVSHPELCSSAALGSEVFAVHARGISATLSSHHCSLQLLESPNMKPQGIRKGHI